MLVIPAIDLKGSKCVRLQQGNMGKETVYSTDPVGLVGEFVKKGCQRLHIVDLDGAITGSPQNFDIISDICRSFPSLSIQLGGGIRSLQVLETYFDVGISCAILGTKAVERSSFFYEICNKFPKKIMLGIDARKGKVLTKGWLDVTSIDARDLVERHSHIPIAGIVYTDVERDGMLSGINIDETKLIAQQSKFPVFASGGISSVKEIEALANLYSDGIEGVILGKAIYEGQIDLSEAIDLAKRII